ncbi:MAG: DUF4912 domain-containing protein [Spirochaetales bacterium]|nr:DUF4912 domain-containing protein [Spirochaetales bacterium]
MLLINIESLSENELRYIAKQEDLEDWDSLSRDELIDELENLYEDDGDVRNNLSGSSKHKFVNTLTDVASDDALSLPGVQALPESYNETSIHIVMKDFNWAYVFWSISNQQLAELEGVCNSLILRTERLDGKGVVDAIYDIEVSFSDDNWTVELPYLGYSYQVCIVAKNEESETIICKSSVVTTTKSWFAAHPDELRDGAVFRKFFSSLVSNGGIVSENRQVQDLIEMLSDNGSGEGVLR